MGDHQAAGRQAPEAHRDAHGLIVCRLGGLLGDSVYLTSDPDCFRIDGIKSRSGKDIDSVTKLSTFYGSVSIRIPEMAPMIAEAFEASLQGVLAAGRAHIPLPSRAGRRAQGSNARAKGSRQFGGPRRRPGRSVALRERGDHRRSLASIVEVGLALVRIRDGQQYQATHPTFEA